MLHRQRWRHKALVFVATTLALLAVTESTASAHYIYRNGYTYQSGGQCVWNRVETSHGSARAGYFKSDVGSKWASTASDGRVTLCGSQFHRPQGHMYVAHNIYKWTGSWSLCVRRAPVYNSGTTSHMTLKNVPTSPYCGPGYYNTHTWGYANNGAWYGGGFWSGYHYLPT